MMRPSILFVACTFSLFLVPQLVASGSLVKHLPGFKGPLPFELETGYVGVDESEDAQLFYFFMKSERNPKEAPLLVWLTGGPGCSSWFTLVYELGPVMFKVEENNGSVPTLLTNPDAWTKVASLLLIESPVGAGFSYARTLQASYRSDLKQFSQIDQFLRKWLMNHPEYIPNPLYVGGDSYAGKIAPGVVQQISTGNKQGINPVINLQGYLLGNPVSDEALDNSSRIAAAHGLGLLSNELYESLKRHCGGEYSRVDPGNSNCVKNLETYYKCISDIEFQHVLIDKCERDYLVLNAIKPGGRRFLHDLPKPAMSPDCYTYRYHLSNIWANMEVVREALHVRKGTKGDFRLCDYREPYTYGVDNSFPYLVNISKEGYRSLAYSGDHDLVVPHLSTQALIKALNYSIVDDWRPWMIDGQVAGYTRTFANNMTFATIKGGGHTVEFTRATGAIMFKRWIAGGPL